MKSSGAALSFSELQARFVARLGGRSPADLDSGTIVVVSSISFVPEELRKIAAIEHYEERLLCMLLELENPMFRVVFVSSMPIDEAVIDYYLSFLPDQTGARERCVFVSTGDNSPRALSDKLLERPDLLDRIRSAADHPDAFILPFNVTERERMLAEALQLPVYGAAPELARLGTKSGSRAIAREAGVRVLPGAEEITSIEGVEAALRELCASGAHSAVIKLNHGFSGQGNAIVDLHWLRSPLVETPTTFCAAEESWETYAPKIAAEGVVVESLVRQQAMASPSVQLRIVPGGKAELLSTHDQILGGPDNQVYLGCGFPARRPYRALIERLGLAVAEVLAAKGVIGSFGVDFVVVPEGNGYTGYLSEINLRMGGTTHPFLAARRLTGATIDPVAGALLTAEGHRYYVASDNFKSAAYVGMTPIDAIAALRRAGLAFDGQSKTGVMLHLLGALRLYGKLGALCIAPSRDEAQQMYERVGSMLDETAR